MTLGDGIQKILLQFSPSWISFTLNLLRSIQAYSRQRSPEGLYEVLTYETTLELLDPHGRFAHLSKYQRIKFLQDHVIAFEDYAWGEGNVLAEYKCTPGFEADRYLEGDRWNILISLRETKRRGDVQDFYIERKLTNTFTKKQEWWQIEMQHRTRFAKLSIIFPKKRHCVQAVILERTSNRTIPLNSQHFTLLPDGRQRLTWENIEPRIFETYTLRWTW